MNRQTLKSSQARKNPPLFLHILILDSLCPFDTILTQSLLERLLSFRYQFFSNAVVFFCCYFVSDSLCVCMCVCVRACARARHLSSQKHLFSNAVVFFRCYFISDSFFFSASSVLSTLFQPQSLHVLLSSRYHVNRISF